MARTPKNTGANQNNQGFVEGEILGPDEETTGGADPRFAAASDADEDFGDDWEEEEPSANDNKQKNTEVPVYATADRDTRRKMDVIIKAFDMADVEAVMGFGSTIIEGQSAVYDRACAESEKYARSISGLGSLGSAAAAENLGDMAREAGDAAKQAGGKAVDFAKKNKVLTAGALVLVPVAGFMSLGALAAKGGYDFVANRFSSKEKGKRAAAELDSTVKDTATLIKKLDQLALILPKAVKVVGDITRARVESYRDLLIYQGAGDEILRRHREEIIPALQGQIEKEGNVMKRLELEDRLAVLNENTDEFDMQLTELAKAQGINKASAVLCASMRQQFATSARNVKMLRTSARNEWKAQGAQAGVQRLLHTTTEVTVEAAAHTGELSKQVLELSRISAEQAADVRRTGTISAEQVLENAEKAAQIFREFNESVAHADDLAEVRAKLANMSRDLSTQMIGTSSRLLIEGGASATPKAQPKAPGRG